MGHGCRALAQVALISALGSRASAQDAFEIQVYDTETAPKGEPGLEVHANHHLIHDAPDALHLTLEPHYGLSDEIELGGYLQGALDTTGDTAFAGVKLRAKLRAPERYWCGRLGLAINFEVSAVPSRFEPAVWGSEVRPVVDLRAGRVYASVNPIVATDLAGSLAGHPQLEPAAKLAVVFGRTMVGVEGYAGFGPIDDLGSESVLRGFLTVDVRGNKWDLNLGVGANHGSPDHPIAKLIFGMHP